MRKFEYALNADGSQQFTNARFPEYATKRSAGADFFAVEDVEVPSIFRQLITGLRNYFEGLNPDVPIVKPVLIHTGIKACMGEDEVLELYNRSSNPKKTGLILANGVGVVDSDYYSNKDNDGEIMFAFYNFFPFTIKIKAGDRIGQGVFKKFLRPTSGYTQSDKEREGGFGSTGGN